MVATKVTVSIFLLMSQLLLCANEAPSLFVKAKATREEAGRYQCLINVINQSKMALTNVRITIFTNQRGRFSVGPINLAVNQAIVFQQNLDKNYCGDIDLFFRVTFEYQGTINELLIEGQRGPAPTAFIKNILGQVIPWLLGLFSAIIGGWVTHYLSLRREREKDRVTRATKQYDALVPAFQNFLQSWGANPVPEVLHSNFSDLERTVMLNPEIVQLYRETYKVLAEESVPMDRKREAAGKLDRYMREYIRGFDVNAVM